MSAPPKPLLGSLRPVTLPSGMEVTLTAEQLDRLWVLIEVSEAGCWIWTGRRLPSGYGNFYLCRVQVYTHRLLYMITTGPIATGLHTDHLCRNPPCCNPEHLEPVAARENVMRSPIAPAALNARKTHCKQGHPLADDNLAINTAGARVCRTCARIRYRVAYAKRVGRVPNLDPAVGKRGVRRETSEACAYGHQLDESNSYVDPRGTTRCRQCARESQRRWREKSKKEGTQ